MAKHYTAVVEILEVVPSGTVSQPSTDKTEVARIVVRADSLEELRTKVGAHIALI